MVLLMSEDMNIVMGGPVLPVLLLQGAEIRNIPKVVKNWRRKSGNSMKLIPSLIRSLVHLPTSSGNRHSTDGGAAEGVFTYSY